MRLSRTVLLSGAAALGLTGLAALGHAQTASKVMTVQLPNGQLEQIRYAGDVPPQIVIVPSAAAFDSPFAMLEQMSAEMDRQADAMLRAVHRMAAEPMVPQSTEAAFGQLPAGGRVCMRSVQITYSGNGQQPHVVSQSAGDCGPSPGTATPAELPRAAPVPDRQHRVIEVKAGHPYQRLVQQTDDSHG
jgi:hypothetical protein